MTKTLGTAPMHQGHVWELAGKMRSGDRVECIDVGLTPKEALQAGLEGGWNPTGKSRAVAVVRLANMEAVGAFGWTDQGIVWSLWADLKGREFLEVAEDTPRWLASMVQASGHAHLHNHISTQNDVALAWLRLTHCFEFATRPHMVAGVPYLRFRTKPLEALQEMTINV